MTSGTESKRRRQLHMIIPPARKKEMKDVISGEAKQRTDAIHKLSVTESQEINDIKNRYREQREQIKRSFERTRTEIITKYEDEFGADVVKHTVVGLGI